MKVKHFYYACMTICFFMTMFGVGCEDDNKIYLGMLGTISSGIHYLAEKIKEMRK